MNKISKEFQKADELEKVEIEEAVDSLAKLLDNDDSDLLSDADQEELPQQAPSIPDAPTVPAKDPSCTPPRGGRFLGRNPVTKEEVYR
jgi:hypothetical protein